MVYMYFENGGKRRNCLFPTISENFPPFSSTSKLSSANSFSLGEFKICHLVELTRYSIDIHFNASTTAFENIMGLEEIARNEQFLAPLAVGQRAYVMARCPSCVRPSVRALTFSLNIFFAETTYRILMKFHRNVPTMVLFRIS